MATIKDIATRLGVSVSTVSKGLNGASDISEELRQMVLDTAVEMGYATKKSKKKEKFPVPFQKRKTLAAKQRRPLRIPLLKYEPKIPLPRLSKGNLKKQ